MAISYMIFDDIGEETLYNFSGFLSSIPDDEEIYLEICSHGGAVFYGSAICQKIEEAQRRGIHFTARIYGVAASSAADIVLACNRLEMAESAAIMIHSAFSVDGSKDEGISVANDAQLAVIRKRLPDYTEKDLQKDRWFRAQEALEIGLIDAIFDSEKTNRQAASLVAAYMAKTSIIGEVTMEEEVKKEEVVEEKREDVEERREPSLEEVLDKIASKLAELEQRVEEIEKIEEARAECGDPQKRDDRMSAIYEKISAVCTPCAPRKVNAEKKEDPNEELEKYKAKYGDLSGYIKSDNLACR